MYPILRKITGIQQMKILVHSETNISRVPPTSKTPLRHQGICHVLNLREKYSRTIGFASLIIH